jgi:flavin reductase (DIM6/NTAB) family NADH-FMN oxidoreductase RutF
MSKPATPLSVVSYGLYVVGSKHGDTVNAMTANWLTQVSFTPEIVALAVEKDSLTRRLIDEGRVFAVSVLERSQKEIAQHFIRHQEGSGEKIGGYLFRRGQTGAPVLEDCLAYLDCRVVGSSPQGDHLMVFGEVVDSGMVQKDAEPLTLRETGWRYGG